MTLSVGVLTPRHAILASDRRISTSGAIVSDEYDKTIILFTEDSRLAISFTGLATVRSFSLHDWLIDALVVSGPPDFLVESVIRRLQIKLDDLFANGLAIKGVDQWQKRTSLLMVGFRYTDPPTMIYGLLSNFETPDGTGKTVADPVFSFHTMADFNCKGKLVSAIGDVSNVDLDKFRAVMDDAFLLDQRSAELRIVHLIRDAAAQSPYGTIGEHVSTIVIPSGSSKQVHTDYHVVKNSSISYAPASVHLRHFGTGAVKGHHISVPQSEVLVVPVVPRREMCPCGSGRRYHGCHGRKRKGGFGVSFRPTP